MKLLRSPKDLSSIVARLKLRNISIGFVPTMGALHEGHLSLVRRARRENDIVVVSIFVNPAQFGPREDFKKYPRMLKNDMQLCRKSGVDIVFCPQAKDMYPKGFSTYIEVKGLSRVLCGKSRPGHFMGVATVVAKLFNIVQPKVAYFGQKDAQQAIIIKRMAKDLDFPLKVIVLPIVREPDGLALSSRNAYLNKQERKEAVVLSAGLKLAKGMVKRGTRDASIIIRAVKRLIQEKKSARIDYVSIVETINLRPVEKIKDSCMLTLAVWFGKTRLIDNIALTG